MKSAIKGKKARTIAIETGETFKVFGDQSGVCIINDPVAGRYHYIYRTGEEAITAANEMNARAAASGVGGFIAIGYSAN